MSYNAVTKNGTRWEGISFNYHGAVGIMKYMMLSSPIASPRNGFRTFINGVNAHTGGAKDQHGARPAYPLKESFHRI